jgi:hypothetical protein
MRLGTPVRITSPPVTHVTSVSVLDHKADEHNLDFRH